MTREEMVVLANAKQRVRELEVERDVLGARVDALVRSYTKLKLRVARERERSEGAAEARREADRCSREVERVEARLKKLADEHARDNIKLGEQHQRELTKVRVKGAELLKQQADKFDAMLQASASSGPRLLRALDVLRQQAAGLVDQLNENPHKDAFPVLAAMINRMNMELSGGPFANKSEVQHVG